MDSIRGPIGESVKALPIEEQDSTDLEKALRVIDAPLYLGIGFLGGRLDHTLAAMHALVSAPERAAILLGSDDVVFASPLLWRAQLPVGTRISFFPIGSALATGSRGLRWPIKGLAMEGGSQIGVSNETSEPDIEACFAGHGGVTILPRECFPQAVASLT